MMTTIQEMSNALRMLAADMVENAGSGHPGMPLGMADVATVLTQRFLRFDASCPTWPDRDRVVFSNGHGSALVYALLYLTGNPAVPLEQLRRFRQYGSRTAGHPEKQLLAGVEYSTGPLGQGIAGAVGMALAERMLNARYGDLLINHKTYVFAGDGCLMEGISEEAIALAGHWKLNNLILLWDNNHTTIDGPTDIAVSVDMKKRFQANGWDVLSCDGHSFDSIEEALEKAQRAKRPTLVDCRTILGFGAPTKAGTPQAHGAPLGASEMQGLRQNLGWSAPPFEVPAQLLQEWRATGARQEGARQQWESRLKSHPLGGAFKRDMAGSISGKLEKEIASYCLKSARAGESAATRKASQEVLEILAAHIPALVGGSADLAGPCFTRTALSRPIAADNYDGNYINCGVREHAMAGIMNGLAAHGGFIPYGGTFLAFLDYLKPALRLAALMEQREIFIFTHDSLGLGEDGPTHQPIEQLATLRATPNLLVFRPADRVEVAESYLCALQARHTPSALILSRQTLPAARKTAGKNETQRGGYVLSEPAGSRRATLIATGSEVALALRAQALLARQKIPAAVVSMPCVELFEKQSAAYRRKVLGDAPRLIIEAGASWGWDRFLGETGAILAVDRFGASGKGEDVMKAYGFTPENVAKIVKKLLKK